MTNHRHVALIVEDDPVTLAKTVARVETLLHEVITATNLEEALEKIETCEICWAAVDLEMKRNKDSLLGDVESGFQVIAALRRKYPPGTFPVIVVSAHAKEDFDLGYRVRELGADDFFRKSLEQNSPPFRERVLKALQKAGREDHDQCCLRHAAPASEAGTTGQKLKLAVTATLEGKRTIVKLDEEDIDVTTEVLVALIKLIAGRLETPEGWVSKSVLGAEDGKSYKGVSRIRDQLGRHFPKSMKDLDPVVCHKKQYRLHPVIEVASVDWDGLERHPEDEVQELVKQVRPKKTKGRSRAKA